jgi:hypothetical protein
MGTLIGGDACGGIDPKEDDSSDATKDDESFKKN